MSRTRQQLGSARIAGEIDTQRQRVDEAADQVLEFGPRAIRHRHADDDLLLAAQSRQDDGPAAEQNHEQGRVPSTVLAIDTA